MSDTLTKPTPAVGQVWRLKVIQSDYLFEIISIENPEKPLPYTGKSAIVNFKSISPGYERLTTRAPWDFQTTMLQNDHWTYVSDSTIAEIET
jgi:hypothetical protein